MKKLYVTATFLVIITSALFAGKVEKVYHFDSPVLKDNGIYQSVAFNNTLLTGKPGEPVLPYMQIKLLLPPGESAVGIEVIGMDEVKFPGSVLIYPQQHVRPVSAGSSGTFIKNETLYNSALAYPAQMTGQLITSFLNGYAFALSSFTPVRYVPASGEVSYYSRVKVVISTAPSSAASAALSNLRHDEPVVNLVSRFADNAEARGTYIEDQVLTEGDYQILIITTPEFTSSFASLQASYLTEGLRSQVASTADIAASMTGIDLQEKMRNYIIQEYQQHGIQHVILGGDDELIPHRGFYCHVQSSSVYEDYDIPADLYYSALDGNWNQDGDDKWGEPGEDDLLPDISVGRMSFSNLPELARMIHKSYSYQFTPVAGEFQKVIMAGENLYYDPITWGSDYLELLVGAHDDNGYLTSGIPENYVLNKMYDETQEWDGNDLIYQVNQGFPMLNHVGHANQTYVMKLSSWDITDENFYNANGINHNYTIVYTHGCDCGSFDYNDCIAEEMVSINNFAAAFIGNSRYGWFNEGQTEGPSAHLHREYIDALFTDKLNRIGRAHMESKIATAPWVTAPGQWEPGAIRWCFYDCNVLGDPAMAVWTNDALNITTTYPGTVPLWSNSMNVNVMSGNLGVQGLNCVALMNGDILGEGITDVNGNAVVNFDEPLHTPGTADLVVSGYNCLPTTYDFTIDPNTSVLDLINDQNLVSISPNPAEDQLTITIKLPVNEWVSIKIISSEGKEFMMGNNLQYGSGTHFLTEDIQDLASGIYTCQVSIGKNIRNIRFIKN